MFFNSNNSKKELQALTAKYQVVNAENTKLKAEMADYKKTIGNFVNIKTEYEADIKKMAVEHKDQVDNLMLTIAKEQKSVARKVNLELSRIGVKEFFAEEISTSDNNKNDVLTCWMNMPEGKEKHKFFSENEHKINQLTKNKI